MNILPLTSPEDPDWLQLRLALWPDIQPEEHAEEMASFLAEPDKFAQFIAKDDEGKAWGFVEAALRTDYVNGTDSSPVAFLEGLYVKAPARKKGVARRHGVRWCLGDLPVIHDRPGGSSSLEARQSQRAQGDGETLGPHRSTAEQPRHDHAAVRIWASCGLTGRSSAPQPPGGTPLSS